MLKYSASLDARFAALADPTRRSMIDRLSRGPATVTDLARPLDMSLPAALQHLQILQGCGLVETRKVGRVRTCQLQPQNLAEVEEWLHARRTLWQRKLDRLGQFLDEETEPNPKE